MQTESKLIADLTNKLYKIAKSNSDEFECYIKYNGRYFSFICQETEDEHIFTEGRGETITEAIKNAEENIEETCKEWGYKD